MPCAVLQHSQVSGDPSIEIWQNSGRGSLLPRYSILSDIGTQLLALSLPLSGSAENGFHLALCLPPPTRKNKCRSDEVLQAENHPPSHTCCLNTTFCSAEAVCKWMFRESSSGHACLWEAEITHVFTYVDGCLSYLIQISKLFSKSCIGTHCLPERVPISVCECAIGRCKLLNFVCVYSLCTQNIMGRLCSSISQRSAAQKYCADLMNCSALSQFILQVVAPAEIVVSWLCY